MIKAIVYDLDGMVIFEPHYYSIEMAGKYGVPLEEFRFGDDYKECKKGKMSVKKFIKPLHEKWLKYSQFDLSLDEYIKGWFDFATLNADIVKIAKQLQKKGIVNIIFTNNSRERVEFLEKKFNLSETFIIVGSYDLGVLKPDPKFYKVLQKKYQLKPKEVLVFDDKEEKVQKLKAMGYPAEVYTNRLFFKHMLEKFKVL